MFVGSVGFLAYKLFFNKSRIVLPVIPKIMQMSGSDYAIPGGFLLFSFFLLVVARPLDVRCGNVEKWTKGTATFLNVVFCLILSWLALTGVGGLSWAGFCIVALLFIVVSLLTIGYLIYNAGNFIICIIKFLSGYIE